MAGLQAGDVVLRIGQEEINSSEELRALIYSHLGQNIEITYQRDGQIATVTLVPRDPPPESGADKSIMKIVILGSEQGFIKSADSFP